VYNSIRACERWALIAGYETLYEVSTVGRVRRVAASRMAPAGYVLKPKVTCHGYLQYGLSRHRRYWHVGAHRLVAYAFLGPPPFPGAHVADADGDPQNNAVSNLRWATPRENEADKKRHGRVRGALPGEAHHMARLTMEQVKRMGQAASQGQSYQQIASQFGVHLMTTYDAILGKTWRFLTDPPPVRRFLGGARAS
jgi:hypothetical protein